MREKHVKQLLKEENGSSYKPGASIRAALVFPNSYYLGMSSLGFQVILDEVNRHPDVSCERAFFDEKGWDGVPRSFETQRPLSDFDIVGFSISFELDYLNVVRTLLASGIPLKAKERGPEDPLIIAGGICSSFNPEPISDFIDAFAIGDGEEVVHGLISGYQDWRQTEDSRESLSHRLSKVQGVYVPVLYEAAYNEDGTSAEIHPGADVNNTVERSSLDKLDGFDTTSKILTSNTEFAESFLVEAARGCANRCRFCIASYSQRCRIRSGDEILRLAQSDLAQQAKKIGLVGSSVTDHPQIDEIAASLVNAGKKISIASMRADSVSEALLDALAESGQRTITLAPETASESLRRIIGKDIPLETILDVIRSSIERGILNVKLYFMVGLPTEVQEDADNIIAVVKRVRQLMFDSPRPLAHEAPRLTISISPFVPKPHTPFQWCQMEDVKILSRKLRFLRRELEKTGGIRVSSASAKWSAIQGVIARGDRRLGNVLHDIAQNSVSWNRALKDNNLSQDFYLYRHRQADEIFPWDHLNLGIRKSRLLENFLSSR